MTDIVLNCQVHWIFSCVCSEFCIYLAKCFSFTVPRPSTGALPLDSCPPNPQPLQEPLATTWPQLWHPLMLSNDTVITMVKRQEAILRPSPLGMSPQWSFSSRLQARDNEASDSISKRLSSKMRDICCNNNHMDLITMRGAECFHSI